MQHRFATAADLDRLADWNHQLFVDRAQRRRGIGRRAVERLCSQVFPPGMRVTLQVLVHNEPALAFWRAVSPTMLSR